MLTDPSSLKVHQCALGALIEIEDILQGIRGQSIAYAVGAERAFERCGEYTAKVEQEATVIDGRVGERTRQRWLESCYPTYTPRPSRGVVHRLALPRIHHRLGRGTRPSRETPPSPASSTPPHETATIRRHLITVPARIAHRSRRITLRLPSTWAHRAAFEGLFTATHDPPTPA